MSTPKVPFPEKAATEQELLSYVEQKKKRDIDWRRGRAFCLVYYPGEERERTIKNLFNQYFADNALNPTATPSLVELEAETVSMCAHLFNGDENTRGNITTGGTESILMAVKTARDWARKYRPAIKKSNVVIPESAHPAFMKAFAYFDVEYRVTKVGADYRASVEATQKAMDENTVLLVASAPSYPHGVMDPIAGIAALAKAKNILCHVDACIGGFILPFIKELGYPVPDFDFKVEGVTSISADIHKYGYSSKGASVILYKNSELRKCQFYLYTKWNGGVYGSPTMTGSRPGGSIAGAWAALKAIGREGYLEMADATMKTTLRLKQAFESIPELEIMGQPEASMLAFKSDKIDVYLLADELNKRGWHFERQQLPPSLHFTVNYIHRNVADEFITDLKECVEVAKSNRMAALSNKVQAAAVKGLSKVLPAGLIAKTQQNKAAGLDNENKAAMYGLMGALSGTDDLEQIVLNFLDDIYTAK